MRGVNLGSHFVVEPWMIPLEWNAMGCGSYSSEFDCVKGLGQKKANAAFQAHWDHWVTEEDVELMVSWGLNTIRIPVGWWIKEDLVNRNETFSQGGYRYLECICSWAAKNGIYVVMDLHGAPGAQTRWQAFTGMWVEYPGFYTAYNYRRAYEFLEWMTTLIHTNRNFRTVGMIHVVNEPEWDFPSVRSEFYPTSYKKIRAVESRLRVKPKKEVHIQFMDTKWGAGNPNEFLPKNARALAYDNHRYLTRDFTVPANKIAYINASCNDYLTAKGETPLLVGEWSLGPRTAEENTPEFTVAGGQNREFYTKWWAAQVISYERGSGSAGWAYWSWRTQLGEDYRWGYKNAVEAGAIPKDPNQAYLIDPC
ncbi:glycoside hydrolase family 5 protein [Cadophora sp. DSE1049]|nr:glycoside hydrolase family 5 protein [Cadophora sp. DSE1049]